MKFKTAILSIAILTLISSCQSNEEKISIDINSFIWKGMNNVYLWQEEVPVLDDNRFKRTRDLEDYVEDFEDHSAFFETLKYQPDVVDKWSWIVDDYVALEEYFSGVRKTTGAKIKLHLSAENSSEVYGIVRYVIPGTDAATKNVERGMVFKSVNGTNLTKNNAISLVYNTSSFTINLGTFFYNDITEEVEITPTGEDITLVNGEYTENPVFKKEVFEIEGHKIGYLMYNSFTANYDEVLNDAFLDFKNQAITDLILDVRYNGGGSVNTAIYLSGMITGQYEGSVFTKEIWNSKYQTYLESEYPERLINKFTNTMYNDNHTQLNNLNLEELVVLTTKNSASASELVINALKPYIDVVTIGETTHGKYVASTTIYDAPNFDRENANPDHLWAIQPIILKEVNSEGDYAINGFEPTVNIKEDYSNMGVLGSETETMTARAIDYIVTGDKSSSQKGIIYDVSKSQLPGTNSFENEMYIEKDISMIIKAL